jgi:hypothetical protein
MNFLDLTDIDVSKLRYELTHFSEYEGICALNGMLPIPVDAVSFTYESDEDIEVYDEQSNLLGYLCLCKDVNYVDIESITDSRYIAYINEVDKEIFEYPFQF